MLFENLTVERIVIHEVYRRLDDKNPVVPLYSEKLLELDVDAMNFFRDRVIAAIGSQSQCMQMTIVSPPATESAVKIAQDLLVANEAEFLKHSRKYADKLTSVQTSRGLPGGILVVFCGKAGNPSRGFVGVMKAETHSGFRRTQGMGVQYLKDLFLGPQTKLYKIGVFVFDETIAAAELPNGWTSIIYDSQMSNTKRDGAAQYFYESFLGCRLPEDGARLTKQFYEGTRDFINKIEIPEDKKADLLTSLYTYLKVDQTPTIEVSTYSNNYLSPDLKDDYASFMAKKSFPDHAIPKDVSHIQNYLKRRKLRFSRDVQLTAPPEAFNELVRVQLVEGETDETGVKPVWTQITIRDRIREQT
jgi:hypothetical protein